MSSRARQKASPLVLAVFVAAIVLNFLPLVGGLEIPDGAGTLALGAGFVLLAVQQHGVSEPSDRTNARVMGACGAVLVVLGALRHVV